MSGGMVEEKTLFASLGIQVQHKKGRSKYEKYREAWELLGGEALLMEGTANLIG